MRGGYLRSKGGGREDTGCNGGESSKNYRFHAWAKYACGHGIMPKGHRHAEDELVTPPSVQANAVSERVAGFTLERIAPFREGAQRCHP
jgi:hypothetical protein